MIESTAGPILLWSGTMMRCESLRFGTQRLEGREPALDGRGAGCLSLPRLLEDPLGRGQEIPEAVPQCRLQPAPAL